MKAILVRKTPFELVAIAWNATGRGPVIHRVFLPNPSRPADQEMRRTYPNSSVASCREIQAVAESLRAYLAGESVDFSLDLVALDSCPAFQQAVLRATARIPRGRVGTYGGIAAHLDKPGAARAVGNALANNPFPLLIPCHRVIRSGGHLGGFGGGLDLKRTLLALEGIEANASGHVLSPPLHYA